MDEFLFFFSSSSLIDRSLFSERGGVQVKHSLALVYVYMYICTVGYIV